MQTAIGYVNERNGNDRANLTKEEQAAFDKIAENNPDLAALTKRPSRFRRLLGSVGKLPEKGSHAMEALASSKTFRVFKMFNDSGIFRKSRGIFDSLFSFLTGQGGGSRVGSDLDDLKRRGQEAKHNQIGPEAEQIKDSELRNKTHQDFDNVVNAPESNLGDLKDPDFDQDTIKAFKALLEAAEKSKQERMLDEARV